MASNPAPGEPRANTTPLPERTAHLSAGSRSSAWESWGTVGGVVLSEDAGDGLELANGGEGAARARGAKRRYSRPKCHVAFSSLIVPSMW